MTGGVQRIVRSEDSVLENRIVIYPYSVRPAYRITETSLDERYEHEKRLAKRILCIGQEDGIGENVDLYI